MTIYPPESTTRPCPPWCQESEDHDFDCLLVDHGRALRYHEALIGAVRENGRELVAVSISQEETCENVTGPFSADGDLVGPSQHGPLVVDVGEAGPLTAAQARALAGLLLEAADAAELWSRP